MEHDYIYESPDEGKTIYRRQRHAMADTREIIQETMESHHVRLARQMLWTNILQHSLTDKELKDLLDRAEVYYRLKYE